MEDYASNPQISCDPIYPNYSVDQIDIEHTRVGDKVEYISIDQSVHYHAHIIY